MQFLTKWGRTGAVNTEINKLPVLEFTYTINQNLVNAEALNLIEAYLYKTGVDHKIKHSLSKTHVCLNTQTIEKQSIILNFSNLVSPYTISLLGLNSLSKSIISKYIKTFSNTIICPSFYLIEKDGELLIGCFFKCIKKHLTNLLTEFDSLFNYRELKNTKYFTEINARIPSCILNRINPKKEQNIDIFYTSTFTIEYIKLIYLLYYKAEELEKILKNFDCYLNYDTPLVSSIKSPYKTKNTYLNNKYPVLILEPISLQIISKTNINFFQIKTELTSILNKIVVLVGNFENILFPCEVFSFKTNDLHSFTETRDINSNETLIIGDSHILKFFSGYEVTYFHTLNKEDFDFVLGKKNGKINKIIKSCEKASVTLFPSLYDFQNLENNKLSTLIVNTNNLSFIYEALIDEQPESLIFSIPGFFHKRIIGFGGKNIQKIMKKYGVYVKFMTPVESIGFNGNVLIKTPSKNKQNLLKMKEEILKLSNEILLENNQERLNYALMNFKDLFKSQDIEFPAKKILLTNFLKSGANSSNFIDTNREGTRIAYNFINYSDIILSSYGLEFYKSNKDDFYPRNINFLRYSKKNF